MPKLNAADGYATRNVVSRRSVDFGYEGRLTFSEEVFDARKSRNKSVRQLGKRRLSHNHQQRDAMSHHRIALVGFVSNALIMTYRDPATLTDFLKPHSVWRLRGEMIRVTLDTQTACSKDLGKTLTEIAVGEVHMAQAARS